MKKNILYIIVSFLFLLFNTNIELKAQATCSGTIQATSLPAYPTHIQIGNGTAGNIRVCITANTLAASGDMGCSTAQLVVSTSGASYVAGTIWGPTTPNNTCYTFTTGTGYGFLSLNTCGLAPGANATITWTTVNGSGTPICPTCSDGIQNQGETGVDCGGPCAACVPTCSDGIQNQGETGVDCGGPCAACAACSPVTVTYSSAGSWVAPTGVTSATIQAWGGGGAGGGANATSSVSGGGGGAGGSFSGGVVAVTPGNSYAVVVGAGGVAAAGAAGGAGGTSSFNGTSVVAAGGNGGSLGSNGYGAGATGNTTGNVGTTTFAGGNGVTATSAIGGGGGGGGAGTTAVGSNGSGITGGAGGATGGGAGGNGNKSTTAPTAGTNGSSPGGGGGGAYTQFVTTVAGGNGGAGQVNITYTPPACSGTPNAGVTSASITSFSCAGGPLTLTNTANLLTCGLTGQWQSSPDGSTWTNIAGATGATYSTTISTTTYYRYVVTCTSSSTSSNSNSVQVLVTSATSCCADNIMNYGETSVDCGGPTCAACATVPPATTAGSACSNTVNNTVTLMDCADIGTALLETSSGVVTFTAATTTVPTGSLAPTCGTAAAMEGSWTHYDLAAGVTAMTFNWEQSAGGSSTLTGGSGIYAQVYQGASCASLTKVSCQQVGEASGSSFLVNASFVIQNLDPSQDVWLFVFHDKPNDGPTFSMPLDVVGSATPVNDGCIAPTAATSSISGCNLGSIGDTWLPPENYAGADCAGGAWTSNENTVWYTFQAQATTASISVSNISCNESGSGLSQIGAFTSCSCVTTGSYPSTACFKGCLVGTGTLSLTGLTVGQTIYVAFDGSAGDVCRIDFTYVNLIPLNVSWLDFSAKKTNTGAALFWTTETEKNADRFEVERSDDGAESFYPIGFVKANGTTNYISNYRYNDENLKTEKTFYRLKQIDFNGELNYSPIIFVDQTIDPFAPVISYTDEAINIKFDEKSISNYEVSIYNILGQQNQNYKKTRYDEIYNATINLGGFESGLYIVEVINLNTHTKTIQKVSVK